MEDLSLHMPLWAILYCGLIFASALGTIMISGSRNPLYIVGELLSAAFAIMFFFIYYGIVPYPATIMIPLGMLLFTLYQEIWVNRKLYNFLKMDNASKNERHFTLWFSALFFLIFLSPFLWVLAEVFKHYL